MTTEETKDPEEQEGVVSKRLSENVSESVRAQVDLAMAGELNGLSSQEHEASLAKFGYNEVVVKEAPIYLQILSRYLGIVPLFVTLTAVLSVAIVSRCSDNPE
jgi:hypothetical protein